MIHSALLATLGLPLTAFFSFWAIVFSLFHNRENNVHKVTGIWGRIMLALCNTKVEVHGDENVLLGKPQVFMANHQSVFDILITLAYLPGQFRWIAGKELFAVPLLGRAMRYAGHIAIDRQNDEQTALSMEEAAIRIRDGKSVMTFPEGSTSRNGQIKPFEQGMFSLAIESGAPIVPISIVGSAEILPRHSLRIRPGRVKMVIGKPVPTKKYTMENSSELIQKVRNVIIANYIGARRTGAPRFVQARPETNTKD